MIGPSSLFGQNELVVDDLPGSGRDLVVVERREDVLRDCDGRSVGRCYVEQEDIDEVRPGIDLAIGDRTCPLAPITGLRR